MMEETQGSEAKKAEAEAKCLRKINFADTQT